MIDSIAAWAIQHGISDADLIQVIGAGIAFLCAGAAWLAKKGKLGQNTLERLRRLDRFWKDNLKEKPTNQLTTPQGDSGTSSAEPEEKIEDPTGGEF